MPAFDVDQRGAIELHALVIANLADRFHGGGIELCRVQGHHVVPVRFRRQLRRVFFAVIPEIVEDVVVDVAGPAHQSHDQVDACIRGQRPQSLDVRVVRELHRCHREVLRITRIARHRGIGFSVAHRSRHDGHIPPPERGANVAFEIADRRGLRRTVRQNHHAVVAERADDFRNPCLRRLPLPRTGDRVVLQLDLSDAQQLRHDLLQFQTSGVVQVS